jgi:serine/threonine protein kinase
MTRLPEGVTPLYPHDPDQLGDFRLLGRIGAGGMGTVFLGLAPDQSRVAVKLVQPEFAFEPRIRARFRREAEYASRVASPYVARPVADGVVDGRPYLVTEYVPGPSVAHRVKWLGPLRDAELIALAVDLARALVDIHAAGLVHRDLKPANLILGYDGIRVIDFGVARALNSSTLTSAGTVLGSAGWMAPEQVTGDPVTPSTDIFAWAGVVTYAATGRYPFGRGHPMAVANRVVHAEPALRGVEWPLFAPVRAAFAKNPRHRPSAAGLVAALSVPVGSAEVR